ncbi:MAG: bifunctional pyr operon transcriptional regulator/uracil phosphoribosyltransferase PyrR [Deltaproteobacteria bacterium]|nr:bifunctional pyr operon transcriptional regulator/uracil phosphoribosyltransferase PyrR [Deltaproteobacteria bacterium]
MADKHIEIIMEKPEMEMAIAKLAANIIANYEDISGIVLVGIRTGGAYLATRIKDKIKEVNGLDIITGALDITLYRDDWTSISRKPLVGKTEIPVSIDNKVVMLVDDVLYTGRTARAAMDALIDFGRPKRIELAVLVDRGLREFPVCANYVAKHCPTRSHQVVNVYLSEAGETDRVTLEWPV